MGSGGCRCDAEVHRCRDAGVQRCRGGAEVCTGDAEEVQDALYFHLREVSS